MREHGYLCAVRSWKGARDVCADSHVVLDTRGWRWGAAGDESEGREMRVALRSIGLGWTPCIPSGYSEMTGEPVAQCNSISDQNPCFWGEGPFAYSGYCPTGMPGGLGSLQVSCPAGQEFARDDNDNPIAVCVPKSGWSQIADAINSALDPNAPPRKGTDGKCYVVSGPQAGLEVPCPDNQSIDVVDKMPIDWTKYMWIAGAVIGGLVLVSVMRRR